MKNRLFFIIVALASNLVLSPAYSESTGAKDKVTRAEVKEELRILEAAGFNPIDDYHYPANLATAERNISAQAGLAKSEDAQPERIALTRRARGNP